MDKPGVPIRFDKKTNNEYGKWIQVWSFKTQHEWFEKLKTLKALIKLKREMALFEFWSLNGKTSFELNFECRSIKMLYDLYESSFYYLVILARGATKEDCEERGLKDLAGYEDLAAFERFPSYCMTSFQGWSSIWSGNTRKRKKYAMSCAPWFRPSRVKFILIEELWYIYYII